LRGGRRRRTEVSKLVGAELPERAYRALCGDDLSSKLGKVIPVVTIDSGGWPHPAMLSYGEIVAKDPKNIRLAVFHKGATIENMKRTGAVTLLLVDAELAYYVKGKTQVVKPSLESFPWNVALNMEVREVLEDAAGDWEPDAHLTSGMSFQSPHMSRFLDNGQKVINELLKI
jgi:hypothetical protein